MPKLFFMSCLDQGQIVILILKIRDISIFSFTDEHLFIEAEYEVFPSHICDRRYIFCVIQV